MNCNPFFSRPSVEQAVSSGVEDVGDRFQHDLTQLDTEKSSLPDGMAALSKEGQPDTSSQPFKPIQKTSKSDDGVFTILYSIAKKVSLVGAVYLVGYMNWSVAWLITPIVLAVTREHWRKTNESKREIAKASAIANEKDVILARINDLPAWVCFNIKFSFICISQRIFFS